MDRGEAVLCLSIDIRTLGNQEGRAVLMPLLTGQMERTEASLGFCINFGSVVEQCLGNVNLVLLCRDVQWSVAILGTGMW